MRFDSNDQSPYSKGVMLVRIALIMGAGVYIFSSLSYAQPGGVYDDPVGQYSKEYLNRNGARRNAQKSYRNVQKDFNAQSAINRDIRRTLTDDERRDVRREVTPYVKQGAQRAAQNAARAEYKNNLIQKEQQSGTIDPAIAEQNIRRSAQGVARQGASASRDFTSANQQLRRTLNKDTRTNLRQEVGGDLRRQAERSAEFAARQQVHDQKILSRQAETDIFEPLGGVTQAPEPVISGDSLSHSQNTVELSDLNDTALLQQVFKNTPTKETSLSSTPIAPHAKETPRNVRQELLTDVLKNVR